jgi:hypothetical protein
LDEGLSYELYNLGYMDNIAQTWHEFCQKTIEGKSFLYLCFLYNESSVVTRSAPKTRFKFNEDGCPLLPEVEINNITVENLRSMLVDFLDAHWRKYTILFTFQF